jgi:hypothetical protein
MQQVTLLACSACSVLSNFTDALPPPTLFGFLPKRIANLRLQMGKQRSAPLLLDHLQPLHVLPDLLRVRLLLNNLPASATPAAAAAVAAAVTAADQLSS